MARKDSYRRRTSAERVADALTKTFGTITFLVLNMLFFAVWLVINLDLIDVVPPFDPFPFNLLTMVVSLEAICLSVIVLISQKKASDIGDIREEIDFRVNVQAEKEITKVLIMLDAIQDHLQIENDSDRELRHMKRGLNIDRITQQVMRERKKY